VTLELLLVAAVVTWLGLAVVALLFIAGATGGDS
jgi:hypothetical protein